MYIEALSKSRDRIEFKKAMREFYKNVLTVQCERAIINSNWDSAKHPRNSSNGRFVDSINFASSEELTRHYKKHCAEFGNITEEEYLEKANQLFKEPLSEDVEQLKRSDGSISKYKFSTNEFLAVTKDNIIKTYFLPKDKEQYWRDEHERN